MSCATSLDSTGWIDSLTYNKFPEVDESRRIISLEDQQKVTDAVSKILDLATSITHGHHHLESADKIIGNINSNSIIYKTSSLSESTCPIAWTVIRGKTKLELVATEGLNHPSKKVAELAQRVSELAQELIPCLPIESTQTFSSFSIRIPDQTLLNTDSNIFLETNRKDCSIVTPGDQVKDLSSILEKAILTSTSTTNREENKTYCTTYCYGPEGRPHHRKHYTRN